MEAPKILKYKAHIVFEKICLPAFDRVAKYYQNNEACFMFVEQGEFSVRTPKDLLSYNKKKGLLAKCFDYFFEMDEKQKANNDQIEVLGILLHPAIVEEIFQFELIDSTHVLDFDTKQIEVGSLLKNFKESINILLDNPELADEQLIKTKIKEFVILLSKTIYAPSHLDFLSALFIKNDRDFKSTILNNVFSNLSVSEFAHLCAMSTSSFKRKFKETYNESPKKFVAKKKLEKAKDLLKNSSERISSIAYDCGYGTISTFNRAFKLELGLSPSEFRLDQNA